MKRFASRLAAWAPTAFADLAGMGGLGAISYGAWLIYQPAGFIVAGALVVAIRYLAARGER